MNFSTAHRLGVAEKILHCSLVVYRTQRLKLTTSWCTVMFKICRQVTLSTKLVIIYQCNKSLPNQNV